MLRLSSIALLAALGFAACNLSALAEDAPAAPAAPAAPLAPAAPGHDGPGGKEGRGGHMRERMQAMLFKGITLTDDQKAALEKLKEEHKSEHKKDGGDAKKGTAKEERKAAMEKHLAAIRAILTADQAKIFDENVKDMAAKRAEMEKKHDAK